MPLISGTCFFIASSTPAFNVIGDIGQVSHDPSNSRLTIFLLSMDTTYILRQQLNKVIFRQLLIYLSIIPFSFIYKNSNKNLLSVIFCNIYIFSQIFSTICFSSIRIPIIRTLRYYLINRYIPNKL